MHGYEIKDLYAVLSYSQYLEMCAEPQVTDKEKPMDYEELLEVIDEKMTEHKVLMEDNLREMEYGLACAERGFIAGLEFVKETVERWQMETRR